MVNHGKSSISMVRFRVTAQSLLVFPRIRRTSGGSSWRNGEEMLETPGEKTEVQLVQLQKMWLLLFDRLFVMRFLFLSL